MSEIKNAWKQTAKSFILAFNDLSTSVFKTAKAGYDATVEWAKKDNPHVQAEGTEIPEEDPKEAPQASDSAE